MGAQTPIEEGVRLLILEAGWNGREVLADERVYADGRVLDLDLLLLYRLYPLAVVELGSLAVPLEIGAEVADYAAANGIPFVLAADGEHVLGMAANGVEALGYPEFPAPTELRTALGREAVEEDPRIYLPAALPDMRITAHKALAIARALDAIVAGKRRVLLAMADETGQGPVALQIMWKLMGSGRSRRALYLVSGREMVKYAERLFQPFGERAATIDEARPMAGAERVHLAPVDLFYKGDEVARPAGKALRQYDLIVMADAEAREDREPLLSALGECVVVGFSDQEPPGEGATRFFGAPEYTYPLEAELAIRAAAAEPAEDMFDELME